MEIDMENKIVKNLMDEISALEDKILDYIKNTENWLFYWIDSEEVQKFVEAYPEDYEFMVHVYIKNINVSPLLRIVFDEHPDGIESIERYAPLCYFRETAKYKWSNWNGRIQELQRLKIEEEIQFYKKRIEELESELKFN